ncbi:MAG: B12-binding domain-containing radical SAM protein [Planctomycetes bacterium]|nr:B12-binding domain-containing radical SAM protein [Planctomycetota bacterium]
MRVLFLSSWLAQEPLGVMYLSAALKAAGHETKMIFVPDPLLPKKVRDWDPGVICVSTMTGVHVAHAALIRIVKRWAPKALAIAGGPHPTVVPDYLREEGLDAICIGEGEAALVDFVNAVDRGGDLAHIPNIHWKDRDGRIWPNAPRPLIPQLEDAGFPDRSLVYDAADLYRDNPRKVVKSDRGCPMNCSFCFHHAWKKKVYGVTNNEYVRHRTVDHVIREVQQIRERYPLTFVHFVDDIFNISNSWLAEFAERWPREVGLPFDAILMANMVTERHVQLLRQAGCIYARIAFEAANDHMRNAIMRKNTTRAQLVRAANLIKGQGIRLGSLNMLGGPGATLADDLETVKLNIECAVDHPLVSLLQPYPATDINDMTREMGIATDAWDEFPTQFNRTSSIALPNRHEFENLHKWFPIVVRNPGLLPLARKAIRWKSMGLPFTWMYMLYSEWLVTEQNTLYNRAQRKRGPATWPALDFGRRVLTKGLLRAATVVAGRTAARLVTRSRLGDERLTTHSEA